MRMEPSEPNPSGLYSCPVCGYPALEDPPYDSAGEPWFDICPSCGVEYGYQDANGDYDGLRKKWIDRGMPWHSQVDPRPDDWDPAAQLRAAGF